MKPAEDWLDYEHRVAVRAEHHIVLARQAVLELARTIGFQKTAAHYVATAVSEMASNLVFHSQVGGEIVLRVLQEHAALPGAGFSRTCHGRIGIEVLALDSGPGIPDIQQAMQDGFSTRGSLGGGLPGIKRLMDGFEISSDPASGTRIQAWKWQPCTLH